MQIKQFEDNHLSHYSYAILSECEKQIVLIDPSRNTQPYIDYANEHNAMITGVIETHPHADFISSHLELHHRLGALIYVSKLAGATYPYISFNENNSIVLGKINLTALDTPGHSPDSICVVLEHEGKPKAVFTGDTLFIGDCGRPDLRTENGDIEASNRLARQMYHSLRKKLMQLPDDTIVYPTHGAGTLCGKQLNKANSSTIAKEKQTNWSLQPAMEDVFVNELLYDQPFVPAYFPFDVQLNKAGAAAMKESLLSIKIGKPATPHSNLWIVDTRREADFKRGHLPHSINIQEKGKFETWLGSLILPGELFYLAGEDEQQLWRMMERAASIGYETAIAGGLIVQMGSEKEPILNLDTFKQNISDYTIVDVRNASEAKGKNIFPISTAIPLAHLRQRLLEIPVNKPIVVHCAGGYRSAAGSSMLQAFLQNKVTVYDLGDAVKEFSGDA